MSGKLSQNPSAEKFDSFAVLHDQIYHIPYRERLKTNNASKTGLLNEKSRQRLFMQVKVLRVQDSDTKE